EHENAAARDPLSDRFDMFRLNEVWSFRLGGSVRVDDYVDVGVLQVRRGWTIGQSSRFRAQVLEYVPPKEEATVRHFLPLVMPAAGAPGRIGLYFIIEEAIQRHRFAASRRQ